ncbi:MAG: ion transporter [Planctomycetota bacterium]
MSELGPGKLRGWRATAHTIIFESDTKAGRAFDVALIVAILCSVVVVLLESMQFVDARYGAQLRTAEWFFTVLFTVEYVVRLASVGRPARYARSFFGAVDLLAILPTYLSLVVPGAQALAVVRTLRILRVFRVLKLAYYVQESETLMTALYASRRKIAVFTFSVLSLVTIFGALMYLVEGPASGFTSIPRGMYWAIVTLTTVGYGDISPKSDLGQVISSFIMILGYGIIAVPTGIVTAELTRSAERGLASKIACPSCGAGRHQPDATFCRACGSRL